MEIVIKLPVLKKKQITAFKDNQQAVLCIAYPALLGDDENEYVLKVLNYVLGVGMSSRLFQTIREELGLVYGIYSSVNLNSAYGDTSIMLSTTNKNVCLALSKIKEVIQNLANNGVLEEELNRAKVRFVSNIKMANENTSNIAASNANILLMYNKVKTKEDVIKKIEQVSLEDVNKMAKNIFLSERFCISYVGPQADLNLLSCYDVK